MASNYEIIRNDDEIDDLLNDVFEQLDKGGSRFPGMSYEDGIRAGIDWLTQEDVDHPLEG